jgi:hypothetical protein
LSVFVNVVKWFALTNPAARRIRMVFSGGYSKTK